MENKFEITAADLRPLEEFPLKWRWTDARWHQLPPEILERINPLTETKAAELEKFHKQYFALADFKNEIVERGETINTELEEITAVEKWLTEKIEGDIFVFISWHKDWAVRTTAGIFCRYWNTFCYPASDDLTVSGETLSWILFYHHDEKFFFEAL